MDVEWSHDGRQALLLTQAEVDKTGASYYGKQQLHYINNSGDTALVELSKNGPVYSIRLLKVQWLNSKYCTQSDHSGCDKPVNTKTNGAVLLF